MPRRRRTLTAIVVCASVFVITPSAFAQRIGEGRIVRTPGELVTDGLSRAQSAVRDPFATPQVTQTEAPQTSGDLFSAAALDAVVRMIEQLMAFFGNRLLEQAGLPPLITFESSSTSTGTDGTNDSATTDDGTDTTDTDDATLGDGTGSTDAADGTDSRDETGTDQTGAGDTNDQTDTTDTADGTTDRPPDLRPGRKRSTSDE